MRVIGLAVVSTLFCSAAFAADAEQQIPEQVPAEHWSCKEIAELAEKYGAEKRLPESVVVGGKTCARSELAECLLSILDKVTAKCEKEGPEAVSREDLDRIAALHDALKSELSEYEGYLERRTTIEKVLAKPEFPPFVYKAGLNGFLRGEGVGNFRLPEFSYAPGHSEGRFLYRVKPYFYWHPTGYLDMHLEGQGYGFDGGSQHFGRFSLYQGFIEARLPDKDWIALKAGRQEFSYGSTFILGANSFFDGLAFDAVRLRVIPTASLAIDLLGGLYSTPFNNGFKGNLSGIYATYAFSDAGALEAYMFHDTGSVERHHGEYLNIWGVRCAAQIGEVAVEFEPVYESGRVFNEETETNDSVSAYGGHLDLTVEVEPWGYHNKFLLSYALGSGAKDAVDGVRFNKEFRNPNNDTSLVGDMSVIGDLSGVTVGDHHASGLQDYTFGWGVDIIKEVNFSATGHYFLANHVEDGFSRDVGLETDFTLTCNISDNFSLILGYDHFFTGEFFRQASEETGDIDYGYLMLQFDVSKAKPKKL